VPIWVRYFFTDGFGLFGSWSSIAKFDKKTFWTPAQQPVYSTLVLLLICNNNSRIKAQSFFTKITKYFKIKDFKTQMAFF
jgi:hypothetical protein